MIVVDTHVLIWDALNPNRLSPDARAAIMRANQTTGIFVADITLWEIAMLTQKGRIQVTMDVHSFLNLLLQANEIHLVAISPEIAAHSVHLPATVNYDPADRLIVATALEKNFPLVTADRNLQSSAPISIIW